MMKIPCKKTGDGIEHFSASVRPDEVQGLARAVCDGEHWHLYFAGDEVPAEHAPQPAAPARQKKPGKK